MNTQINMIKKSIKKDIAVIGISAEFSQAENVNAFWNELKEGNELISQYSDNEINKYLKSDNIKNNSPDFINVKSRIDSASFFDNDFFKFSNEEASLMDPQIRRFFEHVWIGLEDSGYNPITFKDKIGLYAAASDNLNWRAYVHSKKSKNVNPLLQNQISNKNHISTLVSYKLNLKGPSYYIDTACSSSLVALHLACRSLLLRECSMAVAGGVSINTTQNYGYEYVPGFIESKDGHCRAFDEDASGTVFGEGVGVVILKRLEDAIADNDNIYAVIKSSSTNNDGLHKIGYTAPSIDGQFECIKSALRAAKIEPESIGYIEAHGTGTKIGDAIEIEALNKVFNNNTNKYCKIGSVKTNIGHLDAASGIAGFIKTVLIVKNGIIPQSLNFESPNSEINFNEGPFSVNTELLKWKGIGEENIRRAGVSSFGIGGTNAHVILENFPELGEVSKHLRAYNLCFFSARSVKSLEVYEKRINDYLKINKPDIGDFCYTLLTGKAIFEFKKILIINEQGDVVFSKDNFTKHLQIIGKEELRPKVVFVFPGQGTQYVNMGRDIYENEPLFKTIVDEGLEIIERIKGKSLKSHLFNDKEEESLLNNTEYTQPLLFLLEYSLAKFLIALGLTPDYLIGHSLGEYTAACISEVFSFETAVKLIIGRSKLMGSTAEGGMLTINISYKEFSSGFKSNLDLAAINTGDSCVVSGSIEDIIIAEDFLNSKKISFIRLKTSYGFHSKMMDSIMNEFSFQFSDIIFKEPKYPFISNETGKIVKTNELVPNYWVNQMRKTVLYNDGVNYLLKQNESLRFLELGPGSTFSNLLKSQMKDKGRDVKGLSFIRNSREIIDDQNFFMKSLGELLLDGFFLNWNLYYGNENRSKISTPSYPFDHKIFPSRVDPLSQLDYNIPNEKKRFSTYSNQEELNGLGTKNLKILSDNPIEEELTSIWKDFFDISHIGLEEDFFDLGGDSLKAITMANRIMESFDVKLDQSDYHKFTTIRSLSLEIENAQIISKMTDDNDEDLENRNELKI